MQVRKYNPETDFEMIQSWGKKYDQNYDKELLSPLGFIIPGVCAYFIYETPSKVCWLENMIKNPEMPNEVTTLGLEYVVTEVLREVNRLGYKVAYATTANDSVIKRAVKHGALAISDQTHLQLKFK